MDAIKSWAMTLCFAAIAAGMAGIIAPSGNLEKVYKFAVSLFFLACVLIPVFQFKNISLPEISISQTDISNDTLSDVSKTVADQEIEVSKEKISELITQICKQAAVTPLGIYVNIDRSKDGALSINKIKLILRREDMKRQSEIQSAVKKELGLNIEVYENNS